MATTMRQPLASSKTFLISAGKIASMTPIHALSPTIKEKHGGLSVMIKDIKRAAPHQPAHNTK